MNFGFIRFLDGQEAHYLHFFDIIRAENVVSYTLFHMNFVIYLDSPVFRTAYYKTLSLNYEKNYTRKLSTFGYSLYRNFCY